MDARIGAEVAFGPSAQARIPLFRTHRRGRQDGQPVATRNEAFVPSCWPSTDGHKKAAGKTAFELIRDLDQRSKSELT
jgi:hypothetical protein